MKEFLINLGSALMGVLVCFSIGIGCSLYFGSDRASNVFARSNVLLLYNDSVRCTGTKVLSDAGKAYTLTALHCEPLADATGTVLSVDERGNKFKLSVVAKSTQLDLMILTSPVQEGFRLSKKPLKLHDAVHTMTHGMGMPSFRTDGEALCEVGEASPLTCLSNNDIMLNQRYTASTAEVLPGSSGGPLLNADGDLVGIVDAMFARFSYSARLEDIRAFMNGL